jgi:hypothetical protein
MRYLTIFMLLLAVFGSGCHLKVHDEISGSGVRQRQKRDLAAFTSISTQGAFDINVTCQQPQSIEVEGDDNLLPIITTEVSDGVLHIRSNRSFSVNDPIEIKISMGNLQGISTNGAGTINISGLKNDKFEIDANGASTIRVSGEAQLIDIDTNGAGKIDAHKLRASRGVVEAKGVARVDVNVSEQLDVTVSGPSRVTYQGDPVLNKTVHGPGSVERKEPDVSFVNRKHEMS